MFGKFQKYKFTDKKHSKGGIISSLLLLISAWMLGYSIYLSFKEAGNGGYMVGLLAMLALLVSIIGFFVGVKSFKEEDVFYGYSWFGTVGNTIIWLFLGCLMLVGL